MIERRIQDAPMTVERRKRGRPPLADGDPSTDVCVALPGSVYDRIYQLAIERRVSVPALVRQILASRI